MGGRAIVKALGDLSLVHAALIELKPEHDSLWGEAVGDDRFSPPLGFEEGLTESSGYVEVPKEPSRFDIIG
jgi:hypothetical protein